jgi:hypothetical protein
MRVRRKEFIGYRAVVAILLVAMLVFAGSLSAQAQRSLPERLSSAEFWKLVTDISEPGGYFRIVDNFTSNESEVAAVFTALKQRNVTSSVYMGVGPEKNYSYIAATRPKMAFIVDIRRQAVVQHLMFKAMFEMSNTRADFVSILFNRPKPAGVDTITTMSGIWDAMWYIPVDTALQRKNYNLVHERLTKTHGFMLNADEVQMLQHLTDAFTYYGPTITTQSGSGGGGGRGGGSALTFADLTGYMWDESRQIQSFMSTDDNFRFVKGLHERNLIVAVSGDFGGPKALRAIGAWLKENGGVVSAYYVSNVEQYLFGDGKNAAFYANVAALPTNGESVFIRPYSIRGRGGFAGSLATALCPIQPFLQAVAAGRVYSNEAAQACVR